MTLEATDKGRLVEHVAADPLAAGNAPGPFVVTVRIAEQHVEERRAPEEPDMDDPENQGDEEDGDDGRGFHAPRELPVCYY